MSTVSDSQPASLNVIPAGIAHSSMNTPQLSAAEVTSAKAVFVDSGQFTLEVREFGPADGELVILMHGFPECWASWRHQIAPLANAGYRLLVPNLRGYGRGEKPQNLIDYRIDHLAADIDALLQFAGREQCHLIGHDWGGAIAWWYGIHQSEQLASLSILNAPHPHAFLQTLKKSPRQWLKSWYIFFFQLPYLPEKVMALFQHKRLRDTLTSTSNPGSYDQSDIEALLDTWQQPGCTRAMLNYYRCMLRDLVLPQEPAQVRAPTQLLWGEQDLALTTEMAERSADFLLQGQLHRFPDATHWLNHDQPEAINTKLLRFFEQHPINQ